MDGGLRPDTTSVECVLSDHGTHLNGQARPNGWAVTLLLGVLAGLPALSIDLSAPTLVILPQALGTTAAVAGLTVSLFMAGFAIGQLAGGYSSDRIGRRPVLLISLVAFIVTGVGCTASVSGNELVAFRFLQGAGAGSCSVLSFVSIQDLFPPAMVRRKRSYVAVVFGVVPIVAPALGIWVSEVAGWRAVHGVLVLLSAALLAFLAPLSGTWWPAGSGARPRRAGLERRSLVADPVFIKLVVANALSYACIFLYIAGSPFVVMTYRGFGPQVFALVFACTAVALSLGAWASGRLANEAKVTHVLTTCFGVSVAAALVLAASPYAGPYQNGLALAAMIVIMFCRGIISPNLQHRAIERQPNQAGAAAAAAGFWQLAAGALGSSAAALLLPHWGEFAATGLMALVATAAAATWFAPDSRRLSS